MNETLNSKIDYLLNEIENLKLQIKELQENTAEKDAVPYSKVGGKIVTVGQKCSDISTGTGNSPAWNDSELKNPPLHTKPVNPTKGYMKHSHSEFSGGALDINTLELVEYDVDFEASADYNKHCQQYWESEPPIKKTENEKGELVEKKGNLDIQFNAETGKWTAGASEIDVENTLFVKKLNGVYEKDSTGADKKSAIYNSDPAKTNIVWDETYKIWRFYAVFSEV